MNRFEIAKLSVGDVVGIIPYSNHETLPIAGCIVRKINGHGHVHVSHRDGETVRWIFDKNGYDRESKWRGAIIIEQDDALKRIAIHKKKRDVKEKLAAIAQAVEKVRANITHDGYVNQEYKEDLLRLVTNL